MFKSQVSVYTKFHMKRSSVFLNLLPYHRFSLCGILLNHLMRQRLFSNYDWFIIDTMRVIYFVVSQLTCKIRAILKTLCIRFHLDETHFTTLYYFFSTSIYANERTHGASPVATYRPYVRFMFMQHNCIKIFLRGGEKTHGVHVAYRSLIEIESSYTQEREYLRLSYLIGEGMDLGMKFRPTVGYLKQDGSGTSIQFYPCIHDGYAKYNNYDLMNLYYSYVLHLFFYCVNYIDS